MQIFGLQKMTLLDFPGHVACTVFTGGCNFRCPFCHNASLVENVTQNDKIEVDEIYKFLKKRVGLLDGVAITGGEPTLQADIADFLGNIRDMGYKIKLDTNGYKPEKLKELVNAGLVDYVAMDIKNCKEKYSQTAGVDIDISKIEESVEFLMNCGIDYEFRTTVIKEFHTMEDVKEISKWIAGAKKYALQNFEDSGELIGENMSSVGENTLRQMSICAKVHITDVEIRGI